LSGTLFFLRLANIMQNSDWIELFRRIPLNRHEKLVVVTKVGIEIAVQNILRLEPACLMMRGRLAGTTDMGRVFMIPYEQIGYLNFSFEVPVEQFEVMLGPTDFPVVDKQALSTEAELEAESPEDESAVEADEEKPSAARRPVKESLLERLRARAGASKPPRKP
jgi:hypothetical protein